MPTYNPGAQVQRTKYNFVAAKSIHKPDIYPELALRYGSQLLTGLMELVGNYKRVQALEYKHYEEDWIMPKIKATCSVGSAGAAVTFTLDSSATNTLSQQSPYVSGVSETEIPVRLNDVILIKPGSGTVTAGTYIRAFVTAVDSSLSQFTAAPLDKTDTIPAISAADEIVIFSNAFGEDSKQPKSRNAGVIEYTNNVQLIKENHVVTGSEEDIILWFPVKDEEGNEAPFWRVKGEGDTWKRFENYKELGMLLMEKTDNTVITNAQATAGTPILMTEGLIPFILSNGVTSTYSSVTGWTLDDAKVMARELDKQKASKMNMLFCGFDLSAQIDDELGDRFKDGGISYGNFNFDSDKKVALEFQTFSIAGYTYQKKTYDPFNDLQTLGASGFNFVKEGMLIPMDNRYITVDGKKEEVPSLRIRFKEGRNPKVAVVDQFETGDGQDRVEIRYLAECGFEGTAGNRFGYISL